MSSNVVTPIDSANQLGRNTLHLSDAEFRSFAKLVYDNFGIFLTEEKRGLIIGRLQSTLHRRQIDSFSEYIVQVQADRSGTMLSELVNLISTNHTSFFREGSHFQYLSQTALPQVLASLQSAKRRDLRIWCAACSSGEEAYTIQMTLMKTLGINYSNLDAGILATDISTKVLELAAQGRYDADHILEIPKDYLQSFFKLQSDGSFQVNDHIKQEIMFRRFNLMNHVFPFKPFQIIFCRNVMIYFDQDTRSSLLQRFYNILEPGGYLFLGHSETIGVNTSSFKSCAPSVYRKVEGL